MKEDIRAHFLFYFFEILKVFKIYFKIEEAYAPMFQIAAPQTKSQHTGILLVLKLDLTWSALFFEYYQ
jgi:hypothetical protein